jgi:hypothetical protein
MSVMGMLPQPQEARSPIRAPPSMKFMLQSRAVPVVEQFELHTTVVLFSLTSRQTPSTIHRLFEVAREILPV